MLNREKYAKEIVDIACGGGSIALNGNNILVPCKKIKECENCKFYTHTYRGCEDELLKWANSEYKEREIDWSKVPVDTKIVIRDKVKCHFARYEDGNVFYWTCGRTSYSADNDRDVSYCNISVVKIAEGVDYSEWYKD